MVLLKIMSTTRVSQSIHYLILGVGFSRGVYKTVVPIERWEPSCCKAMRKWATERFPGIRYGSIPFCGKYLKGMTQGGDYSCNSQTPEGF